MLFDYWMHVTQQVLDMMREEKYPKSNNEWIFNVNRRLEWNEKENWKETSMKLF